MTWPSPWHQKMGFHCGYGCRNLQNVAGAPFEPLSAISPYPPDSRAPEMQQNYLKHTVFNLWTVSLKPSERWYIWSNTLQNPFGKFPKCFTALEKKQNLNLWSSQIAKDHNIWPMKMMAKICEMSVAMAEEPSYSCLAMLLCLLELQGRSRIRLFKYLWLPQIAENIVFHLCWWLKHPLLAIFPPLSELPEWSRVKYFGYLLLSYIADEHSIQPRESVA